MLWALKRIASLVILLLLMSMGLFWLSQYSPSDPAEVAIRVNAMVPTPELLAQTRHALGLDQPWWVQYGHWLQRALTGDLGTSFVTHEAVTTVLARAMGYTFQLGLTTLVITLLLSALLGVTAGHYAGRLVDKIICFTTYFLGAMPTFWLALVAIWLWAIHWPLLPTSGTNEAWSIVLPAVTGSMAYLSTYVRLIRAEWIACEAAPWRLFLKARHAPRFTQWGQRFLYSVMGSITSLGISVPKLLMGSFVIESIFAWPGLGQLALTATLNRDIPVIIAYTMLTFILFMLGQCLADGLQRWLDPRLRLQAERGVAC